jgi:hypothetical protein
MKEEVMEHTIRIAGLGQLALAIGSLAIPRLLSWKAETASLRPLLRQLFWVYAAYIWTFNMAFGLLSALMPGRLLDGSPLAGAVTGFIALYWSARLTLQFTVLDRREMLRGPAYRLGEGVLVAAFAFLTAAYILATASNLGTVVWCRL